MKSVFEDLVGCGLAWHWRWSLRRPARSRPRPRQPAAAQAGSPAAIAAAKEILTMKNASAMYANAVPNIVEQTKNALMQSNLNYQKDLNEVAVDRRQEPRRPRKGDRRRHGAGLRQRVHRAGAEGPRRPSTSRRSARSCSPTEPRAIQFSMAYMNQWAQNFAEVVNGQFRAEMRKRGKEI